MESEREIGLIYWAGPGWREQAERVADEMADHGPTHIAWRTIEARGNPRNASWAKLGCLRDADPAPEQTVWVADADLAVIDDWAPFHASSADPAAEFAAVPEPITPAVRNEMEAYGIGPDYFNCGLFAARNTVNVQAALSAAALRYPRYGRWAEQTALNKMLETHAIATSGMPAALNTLVQPGQTPDRATLRNAAIIHFCGLGGNATAVAARVAALRETLRETP